MKTVKFAIDEIRKDPSSFYSSVALWLSEPNVSITFRGAPEKVTVVQEALRRTREFQEELNRPSATLQTIAEKLDKKHTAAEAFTSMIVSSWPF